ncbi:hypothetical protein JQX09_18610 [Sulfitobacter pseudonitzschiae]|uniref:Uncharacterized protein n=1 Tax=Pseudosulfitobacter pseudonitzschiae TaxID=1402135 RepID=A0A9Q2NRX5_9RHOB|nr:hypothetical protein [Pseudosulfitobacter pseudonitzschiae]MBM2293993.1 hypothetical protein [Pseudosulfitobacter pseudonitzschiae]MBM2298860.1 hypothetical protein [Pseudosulfitobacter pseudonitzschiae]MBM2303774.1 hypothetical protein [Pseudosulfitobacter pseudonitzschiae]MBM2313607.1 hypothetical protein [Pseudosulfitobacter pseudonitzschiae]MBM2318471.1 hypothetical protein [Pseudosulfitobacter pseudonitzschiae]
MSDRPTFEDIRREQENFIGPRERPQGPKMQRKLTEADEIYVDTIVTVSIIRTALEAGQPVDPEHLPDKILEIIEANCTSSNMPVVGGRPHYHVDDVVKALDIRNGGKGVQ